MIPAGKHKGKTLEEVVRIDPNYALWAHATCAWFPKLTQAQIADCNERYRSKRWSDWSTYDLADYGQGWM